MPRFRAAYDLLVLRAGLGLAAPETATWWTHLQTLPEAERERMAENSQGNAAAAGAEGPAPARPRRRRRRRRPGAG
jgi:poly(A) polymerase